MSDEAMYRQLVAAAKSAAQNAYVPFSNFRVGAALLTADGTVVTGCNVENSVLGGSICAERTALVKAVSEGHREFQAIAVHCVEGEGWPCGVCRQFLCEFGGQTVVIVESDAGNLICCPISELLPEMPVQAKV